MLTHLVMFKFKKDRKADLPTVREKLLSLHGQVPQLQQIEVGLDVLHSARSYDLALLTRFHSMADMEAYQIHPAHVAVLDHLKTVVEASVAVDYES